MAAAGTGGSGGGSARPEDATTPSAPEDDAGAPPVEDGGTPPPQCPDCCPDGFPRGKAGGSLRKLAGLTPSPEGVAVCPDGNVFAALDGSGELWRIPLDGAEPERWAKLGDRRPAGLACDARGRLFVAIFSTLSGASGPISAVMVPTRDAEPIALPQPDDGSMIGGLNGIVAVDGTGVYAGDSNANTILLVRESSPGTFTTHIVARDVPLANGLAYDAAKRTLYAVASGAGQVLSFAVAADGALGERKQVSVGALILFMDGVAVDERSTVYVADYLGGGVIRAKDGVRVAPAASGGSAGLRNPASFAFRGGTLLITDYHVMAPEQAGGLYAIDLGVCGGQP
jgi:sugar lactone lactonase YvrE